MPSYKTAAIATHSTYALYVYPLTGETTLLREAIMLHWQYFSYDFHQQ